jgi:hypothetical protein
MGIGFPFRWSVAENERLLSDLYVRSDVRVDVLFYQQVTG